MKRYSPSSTETWLTCPIKRSLHGQWQPRRAGKRELGAVLGTAFAAGMTAWQSTKMVGGAIDEQYCATVAVGSAQQQLAEFDAQGIQVAEYDLAQRNSIERRVHQGVLNVIAQDPIPPTWQVRDVERILPEWGECRLDIAFDSPLGLVVGDWKCKLSLDSKWLPREVDRWRLSEQRFHYSHAYADFAKQPVYAFYIFLVVLEPFRVHVIPFVNHPEEMALWLGARQQTWQDMEDEEVGKRRPGMAAKHHDEFGLCEFQRACFEHLLDPALMEHEYAPRKAKA